MGGAYGKAKITEGSMPSKQTAAMDKAQRLYMAGETNIKALAKKCKVDPSSIYRAKWLLAIKAAQK